MSESALIPDDPSTPAPDDRAARLEALIAKREAIIRAGMETWSIDRINEDVKKRRD